MSFVLASAQDSATDLSRLLVKQGFSAASMMNGGQYEIMAQMDGRQTVRLLVDTGCDVTTFDLALMMKLRYPLKQSTKANTLGGSMEQQTAIVESIRVGDITMGPAMVGCMSLEHVNKPRREHSVPTIDGILGMDLLTRHSAIIDVAKSILYLKKN
jgi:hypothetical protein